MTAFLLFLKAWWKPLLCAAVAIGAAVWIHAAIAAYGAKQFEAGRSAVVAEDAKASAKAWADYTQKAADAAATAAWFHDSLNLTLPTIEATTHDAIAKIHTIYVASPAIAAQCRRPPGVQEHLDAAVAGANAAARHQL